MAVDWTKPLELMDGTPVRLEEPEEMSGLYGGTNPDCHGHYWVVTPDGYKLCFNSDGSHWNGTGLCNAPETKESAHTPNEETIAAMAEVGALEIIRNLLDHAVYDREKSDECLRAVGKAEAFMAKHTFTTFQDFVKDIETE